jgi:hypothetical protein
MSIDWEALAGGEAAGRPPAGTHQAVLDSAGMKVSNSSGDDLILTEWKTIGTPLYAWTTWFNFKRGMEFTREFLDALGINLAAVARERSVDLLDNELSNRVGTVYTVQTSHWGDTGVNTTVLSREEQQRLTDAPTDPVTVPAAADDEAEDIPF